uniref:Dynein regulatory complex subunit 2 n=1 Tax=Timema monikensis TaxID=170555 RepID=A0A7R9HI74_9NEOP|nr:unnamed protein product [Timema monikensis]
MGPKKKGKGSKLARMTEEEKARYLQHRAAIEEEARRRKQQLIATFMKNKLKKEEAFTRLNLAKINQQWRQILRSIKSQELRQELEHLWTSFEHLLEVKQDVINSLLHDLEDAEEQYNKGLRYHTEMIDQLLALHERRLSKLHDSYVSERVELINNANNLTGDLSEKAVLSEDYLKTIIYLLETNDEKDRAVSLAAHAGRMDDVRNNTLAECEVLQTEKEYSMERLWRFFHEVLLDYAASTEPRRAHYAKLKARDAEHTVAIAHQAQRVNYLQEQVVRSLKAQMITLKESGEQKVLELKAEREECVKYFWGLRRHLSKGQELDKEKLTRMTVQSNRVIKRLESVLAKGDQILKLSTLCRKYETEQEKIVPFECLNVMTESEKAGVDPSNVEHHISEEAFHYSKLDNFWQRYNQAYLERAALSVHHEALKMENQQLQGALKHYLSNVTLGPHEAAALPLPVARPGTSVRKKQHVTFLPVTGVTPADRKKQRPVTCIEASTSIAVRQLRRSSKLQF